MAEVYNPELPVMTFGNWVLKAEWLSGLWNYMYVFYVFYVFSKSKKTWLFTFFWVVAHVFPNSDVCWPRLTINASRGFVSISWASCSLSHHSRSCLSSVIHCSAAVLITWEAELTDAILSFSDRFLCVLLWMPIEFSMCRSQWRRVYKQQIKRQNYFHLLKHKSRREFGRRILWPRLNYLTGAALWVWQSVSHPEKTWPSPTPAGPRCHDMFGLDQTLWGCVQCPKNIDHTWSLGPMGRRVMDPKNVSHSHCAL